jgi:hypothetical protein
MGAAIDCEISNQSAARRYVEAGTKNRTSWEAQESSMGAEDVKKTRQLLSEIIGAD